MTNFFSVKCECVIIMYQRQLEICNDTFIDSVVDKLDFKFLIKVYESVKTCTCESIECRSVYLLKICKEKKSPKVNYH